MTLEINIYLPNPEFLDSPNFDFKWHSNYYGAKFKDIPRNAERRCFELYYSAGIKRSGIERERDTKYLIDFIHVCGTMFINCWHREFYYKEPEERILESLKKGNSMRTAYEHGLSKDDVRIIYTRNRINGNNH